MGCSAPSRCARPTPAMDLLLNRWLLDQVLACRIRARSAFYQSGGAYGFRDQLQDVMALVHAAPEVARAHILLAASRQFVEGDVQHWWHPPAGRGVRTRFSDDYLWLPYVACHYATTTGDAAIFDELVPYLTGPELRPGQEDDYGLPDVAEVRGTLYDHCVRALERGMRFGPHGLPLMGTGDWNDGMNRVGAEGRGESVWVAWFLIATLRAFADAAEARGDADRAARSRRSAESLRVAVEQHAWDGGWYLRAFFDDGTPLGSARNDECQIDSIAQSWAVISGAGDPERARRALEAVDERLVRREDGLILLFDPPFDAGPLDPGYIKGYLPGIRENGGQYTHAATWVVLAFARIRPGPDRVRAVQPPEPDPPRRQPRGGRPLQGRAVRRRGRRLRAGTARRPGRMDLVHRVGLLALPGGPGGHPRLPPRGRPAHPRSVHPRRLAGLRADLSPPDGDLPDRRGQPARGRARHPCRDPRRIAPARRCHPARGRRPRPRGPGRHGTALNSRGATAARESCRMALGLSKRVRERWRSRIRSGDAAGAGWAGRGSRGPEGPSLAMRVRASCFSGTSTGFSSADGSRVTRHP